MKTPTLPELMKLIAELNRWGNESSRVSIGYMPARKYNGYGESEGLNYNDWGWTAVTNICGMKELDVAGQGKTPEEALWKLAKAIPGKLEQLKTSYIGTWESAQAKLTLFMKDHGVE